MGFSCIFNIFAASVTGPALYGPSYIANSLVHDLASETLRSSAAGLLGVPSKSPKKMEDAAFVNYSQKAMEHTTIDIREARSLDIIKESYKLNSCMNFLCCKALLVRKVLHK